MATPGVKDGDLENQAPKDKEAAQGENAMEGKVPEPVATEIAAVGPQQHTAEQVPTIDHHAHKPTHTRSHTK